MTPYPIEQISRDQEGLLTGSLVACAVARCRAEGGPPWPLATACDGLPRNGTGLRTVFLTWHADTERKARRAERTFEPNRVTEDGAIGVCAAAFAALGEGEMTEVTRYPGGADYWIDDRRAVLEISGIGPATAHTLASRHAQKVRQLKHSHEYGKEGAPGYVFVVHFGEQKANLSYHPAKGVSHER